ncbi:hypothetical protein F0U60_15290 [Archangium minus]|uniref:Lipoprotein n=1 Tax=Archangium minus TaxID=83450 RepID=A0ABY9WS78_9BACT|nr:hypothetical protein F0U60_15290 [Archangium minus]
MRNHIASAVLSLGLMAGFGCGPLEMEPTEPSADAVLSGAEAVMDEAAPKQGADVSALASRPYLITWSDFSRTAPVHQICTSYHFMSCRDCYLYNNNAYYLSRCVSPTDIYPFGCSYCNSYATTDRVLLPDGDLIDVSIEHNATSVEGIEFRLESAPNVRWWKQVALTGVADNWTVWNENGQSWCNWPQPRTAGCNTNSQWTETTLNPGSMFIFSKVQPFGNRTESYVLYNLAERLTGGDRVTFRWVEDVWDQN